MQPKSTEPGVGSVDSMLYTMSSEHMPLGDTPFLDLALASAAPQVWEEKQLQCVTTIFPRFEARLLSEGKRKQIFATSPTLSECRPERPAKIRRTELKRESKSTLPDTPSPGVFLNTVDHAYTSIAAALHAAEEGDTIFLRPGVHTTREPFVLAKRNVTIAPAEGAHSASPSSAHPMRDCSPPQSVAMIAAASPCAVHIQADDCVVRDVAIKLHGTESGLNQGQDAAARRPSQSCITIDGNDSRIENCNIEGGYGGGVAVRGQRAAVRSCSIHGCSKPAVSCESATGTQISSNSLLSNRGKGIVFFDESDGAVEDNFVCQTGDSGIECLDRSKPTIRNNHILDGSACGVWIRGRSSPCVSDNRLLRNGMANIRVSDEGDPSVERNRLCDGRQSGVVLEGCARGSFTRNSMYGHRQAGVQVCGSAQPLFMGNSLTANQAGGAVLYEQSHSVWVQNEVQRNPVLGLGVRDSARVCLQGDVFEGNGGTGLCIRGCASASLESCVVADNVGAGVRCWDDTEVHLGRCRIKGAGGRGKQTIGLFCGGRSRVEATHCAVAGHGRANIAANQELGGRGVLTGCRVMAAAGEGVLLCGEGCWKMSLNRIEENTTSGLRCSGASRLCSDGDVVERTAGVGIQLDGRCTVQLRNSRLVSNKDDGVTFCGSGSALLEQCLVMHNGSVGVRVHGEEGSSVVMSASCVVGNGKGALRAGKTARMLVKCNILAGKEREATVPVVLEGQLTAHQAYHGNIADGVIYLSESGGGWRKAAQGAHGSNVVAGAEEVRQLAHKCVESGLVCRCWTEAAVTVQMPDGSVWLGSKVQGGGMPAIAPSSPDANCKV